MAVGAFERAGDSLANQMMAALDAFGEIIMAESLYQCPIDTGTLRGSARVGKLGFKNVRGAGGHFIAASSYAGDGEVIIGYGFGDEINPKTRRPASEYAVPVHEIIEAYHEPPTKAKFLEDPIMQYAPEMEPFLASWMNIENDITPVLAAFVAENFGLADKDAGDRLVEG